MAITAPASVNGPAEKPDAKAASQGGKSGEDRPGFDLGGSTGGNKESPPSAETTIPGGSANQAPLGTLAADTPAGAPGMNDGAGRSTGGTAGGSKPGEATQATAGAVRPPQSTSGDQTFTQGNPDDAA